MRRPHKGYRDMHSHTRVDPHTVKVGDRVLFSPQVAGTVKYTPEDRAGGVGSILWDGDAEPVESPVRSWRMLARVPAG